jgi:hypothetical protein
LKPQSSDKGKNSTMTVSDVESAYEGQKIIKRGKYGKK